MPTRTGEWYCPRCGREYQLPIRATDLKCGYCLITGNPHIKLQHLKLPPAVRRRRRTDYNRSK